MTTTTTTVITALAVILMAMPIKQVSASNLTIADNNTATYSSNTLISKSTSSFEYGCLSNVNVELGENCSALIIPTMLVTGDTDDIDDYNIMIDGQNTDVLSGCGAHTYTIEIIENGEVVYNCWGNIFAEDKTDPQIDCPADLDEVTIKLAPDNFVTFDLFCNDVDHLLINGQGTYTVNANGIIIENTLSIALKRILDITGYPDVTDNCGPVLVTISDQLNESGDCGEIVITRTFSIADRADGQCIGDPRTNECSQNINFRRPSLADVNLPDGSSVLQCNELFETDGEIGGPDNNPSSSSTSFPSLETAFGIYNLADSYCNIGASYSDEPRIVVCEGTYEFRREWNLIDWCASGSSFVFDQFIQVGDFIGPTINLDIPDYNNDGVPDDKFYYSTSPFDCEALFPIPVATITDDNGCSSVENTIVTITDAEGAFVWIGEQDVIVSLAIGDYTLLYCSQDACGNENCEEWELNISDQIAPTASCNDELIVAIGGGSIHEGVEGIAHISAIDINEGSSDNCSEVTVETRRNYWFNDSCHPSENRWSPWDAGVDFYCCDIGQEITVELRVTDAAGNWNFCWMTVIPEDKLIPYCYSPPAVELSCLELPLTFPGDLITAYNDDFNGTSQMMNDLFGYAWGTDNCVVDTVVERSPQININDCGWGTITRRFEAWQILPTADVNGNGVIDRSEVWISTNTCSQLITITETHNYHIDFPQDASADCDDPCIWDIMVEADGCDVLAVNVGDPVRFSATGDECYKLSVTYDVINWCLWDGEYEGYEIPRLTEDDGEDLDIDRAVESAERPVIKGNDEGVNLSRNQAVRTICMDGSGGYLPGDNSSLPIELSDDNPDLNRGRWYYTQFVKVFDSSVPELIVGAFGGPTELCPTLEFGQFADPYGDCELSVEIPFSITDDCELFDSEGELVISLVSAEIDLFALDTNYDGIISANELAIEADIASQIIENGDGTYVITGEYPILNPILAKNSFHAVQVVFEDGCGNLLNQIIQFGVIDCKPPSPVCINGLTVTLMPQANGGCANTIWASDFEASAIYDCTGQGPDVHPVSGLARVTEYAIYRASDVAGNNGFTPYPDHTGLVFNEDDLEDGLVSVYVYAFDGVGNYDYCETYVLVEAHETCGSEMATLSGVIITEENEGVQGVEVNVSNNTTANTAIDGTYSLSLLVGDDYSITPYLDTDPLNGVTTFDIILISKHILGVQPLNSPYKMIAADANQSNTITTLDLIQIRKLILNIITEFPDNKSWRFVTEEYGFPEQNNPWYEAFPELINENNFNLNSENGPTQADFIGVKIGDVNMSAQPHTPSNVHE